MFAPFFRPSALSWLEESRRLFAKCVEEDGSAAVEGVPLAPSVGCVGCAAGSGGSEYDRRTSASTWASSAESTGRSPSSAAVGNGTRIPCGMFAFSGSTANGTSLVGSVVSAN